jgi:hypothetical protein
LTRFRHGGPTEVLFWRCLGPLDAQTPVAAVVPRLTEAVLGRKDSDFTVSVFPRASHLMMEATRPSDEEFPRLTRMVPGYYDLIVEWLQGRLQREER